MKKKYILALSMCALLLLPVVSSCSCKKDVPDETTASTTMISVSTGSNTDANGYINDKLPEYLNLGNEKIRILSVNERKTAVVSEDDLSKSISSRTGSVSERIKAVLEYDASEASFVDRSVFVSQIENAGKSGSDACDIIIQEQATVGLCATKGLLYDLTKAKYLDLTALWWPGNQAENSAVNEKLYAVYGDADLSVTQDTYCVFANAVLANTSGYTDLYGLVSGKSWTIETFIKMKSEINPKTNSDHTSKMLFSYDNESEFDAFFCGAGYSFIENDSEKTTVSDKLSGTEFSSFFESLSALIKGYSALKKNTTDNNGFLQGGALFCLGYISDVEFALNSPSFAVALMPLPLLDSEQSQYRSTTAAMGHAFAITAASENKDAASAVLEALASYGYRNMRPAYFKSMFKSNNMGTSANEKVFDLLHTSLVFDAARLYSAQTNMYSTFRKVTDKSSTWSDLYSKNLENWKAVIPTVK